MSKWIETEKGLLKTFNFKNKEELHDFIDKVNRISDNDNHHASFNIMDDLQLEVYCFTYDTNSITEKDFHLAQKIDEI
jgi:pterin-4a-carbinolamine dehydratase